MLRFRRFNEKELEIIEKVCRRQKDVDSIKKISHFNNLVAYYSQGNFIICCFNSKTTNKDTDGLIFFDSYFFVGVSKYNPIDKKNQEIGQTIALVRAIKSFLNHLIFL